ncbi:MAG TPA: twin-arginine translocase subunit TatC [Syntrophales bacterium]|nr:twin-arginine translocase subunit TatC [Syntrophales bacterium]HPQ42767.1 twin-arginine translocase subunit TatC [Syntrophales bacterium]
MTDQIDEKMPFTQHLEELRTRLMRVLIAVGIGFVICYLFREQLFWVLTLPLVAVLPDNSSMIFTSLPEAFFTYLKVSFFASIFLVSPFILYQLWKFVSPGLFPTEKKQAAPFVIFSTIFFIGGSLFAYYIVFPFGFKFFVGFGNEYIRPMLTLKEYLSFSMKLLIAFGVIFELPIFMFFLARIGLVNATTLTKKRKYAILLVFVVAALFTPPDVVTQVLMALPLMLLYEISVWVVKMGEKNRVSTDGDDDTITNEEDKNDG